ncbi:MAG: palmitoyl-CoA hydrolase [Kordia sp.]|nr:MAG: palmitoyl-CoA hydrolase [Kordia sp.]
MKKYIISIGVVILLFISYFIIDSLLFDGIKPKSINQNGFQANYFAKPNIKNKTAIILLGGSQWGNYWSEQFASKDFVGLSLPYTGNDNLPKLPEEIPLEYFKKAIIWLKKQPEVNPNKIIVMGASRNSELALILGSTFPKLINGVIAYSPSSVSWSNTVLPYNSDTIKASWKYKGYAIPYIPMNKISGENFSKINSLEYWTIGLKKQDYLENAIIKVEKINGPILLFSGKNDAVWPSSIMANMIEKRLYDNHFKYPCKNIQYENAGHLISRNPDSNSDTSERVGKMTINNKVYEFDFGGTMNGDNTAKKLAKVEVLNFINSL